MGWCSGTKIFDRVVEALLNEEQSQHDRIRAVIQAFENADWDCQSDSAYWEHPIVSKVFDELHPRWRD